MGDFVGKVIVVGIVVYALYWFMSPYQNCLRDFGEPSSASQQRMIVRSCAEDSAW